MPNTEFLEKYQLYRKFKFEVPEFLHELPKKNINMYCKICRDIRTFRMVLDYKNLFFKETFSFFREPIPQHCKDAKILILLYVCASCEEFNRFFLVKIGENLDYLEKIGQEPPWDISIEKVLENVLGDYAIFYKNGKICESQSYGIGAYVYYRRMIEEIIDYLLDSMPDLMESEDKEKYVEALKKTKETKNAREKIELVYDLLPPTLTPNGINPLKTLYGALSEGLHGKNDGECLKNAEIIRETSIFLVKTILQYKKERMEFTDKMKKLLKKKKN